MHPDRLAKTEFACVLKISPTSGTGECSKFCKRKCATHGHACVVAGHWLAHPHGREQIDAKRARRAATQIGDEHVADRERGGVTQHADSVLLVEVMQCEGTKDDVP